MKQIFQVLKILAFLYLTVPFSAFAENGDEAFGGADGYVVLGILGLMVLYIISGIVDFICYYRCPKCKKWWVMREECRTQVNTSLETTTREEEIKDNAGNVLRVERVEIPVVVREYEILQKCKHCGHHVTQSKAEREEKYNRQNLNRN